MIIDKIYFDIDGVLADFDKGVRPLCGMTPLPQSTSYPAGYVDFVTLSNVIDGKIRCSLVY